MLLSTRAGRSGLAWLVGAVLLAGATPAAAQERRRACLAPSGDDDTAAIQRALDGCSGAKEECTVTLCAGVFDTGILRVRNFHGTLRGAGRTRTVLRALPDLPVSEDLRDFFREDPFHPTQAWPYLVQFVEGTARVEDLGILVPAPPAGSAPTTGWHLVDQGPFLELRGALLFTGREAVDFEVRRVRVVAENPGTPLETTTFHGAEFGGLVFNPDDPGEFPVFPVQGRFHVTDSGFYGVLAGTPLAELASAQAIVEGNRYRSTIAVDVIDADRSGISILRNRWTVSWRGVQVRQNLDGAPSEASEVLAWANRGRVLPFLAGVGDGFSFDDPADPSRDPGKTALRVLSNDWRVGTRSDPAVSGIKTGGAGRLLLLANRLRGRVATGIDVEGTSGCLVWGNSSRGLDTGAGPDLRLGPSTSDCLAIVAAEDTVVDEGSANRVIRW